MLDLHEPDCTAEMLLSAMGRRSVIGGRQSAEPSSHGWPAAAAPGPVKWGHAGLGTALVLTRVPDYGGDPHPYPERGRVRPTGHVPGPCGSRARALH